MLTIIIEKLLAYAEEKLAINNEDITYYRNVLLNKFHLKKPYRGSINLSEIKALNNPYPLIEELGEALRQENNPLLPPSLHETMMSDVLGMLTPIPSVVNRRFYELYKKDAKKATDYLYDLSVANNYIKQGLISQNVLWKGKIDNHELAMTINLAKPEKDNKESAKALHENPEDKYPSCLLCVENVGFGGGEHSEARHNLRSVPVKLDDEKWYLQYSPFVYFQNHCIVISEDHKPMTISPRVYARLLNFVDKFPHFFVGSNADLPIVGGSILNHEHFQGGAKVMPMFEAKDAFVLKHRASHKVKISILDWYSSVIKLESSSRSTILETASKLTEKWINYENKDLDIIPFTNEERHSTVTPIVTKEKSKYVFYLVLRNNRTNKKYPDGIFHAHPQYHNIKKEGIGLIEQMGTFILPARLKRQFALIEEGLSEDLTPEQIIAKHPELNIHHAMIEEMHLVKPSNFEEYSRQIMTRVCRDILINTSVFKKDDAGSKAFITFLN